MSTYTAAERNAYVPPPCPDCGSKNVRPKWVRNDGYDKVEATYIPGVMTCLDCRGMVTDNAD